MSITAYASRIRTPAVRVAAMLALLPWAAAKFAAVTLRHDPRRLICADHWACFSDVWWACVRGEFVRQS